MIVYPLSKNEKRCIWWWGVAVVAFDVALIAVLTGALLKG